MKRSIIERIKKTLQQVKLKATRQALADMPETLVRHNRTGEPLTDPIHIGFERMRITACEAMNKTIGAPQEEVERTAQAYHEAAQEYRALTKGIE